MKRGREGEMKRGREGEREGWRDRGMKGECRIEIPKACLPASLCRSFAKAMQAGI